MAAPDPFHPLVMALKGRLRMTDISGLWTLQCMIFLLIISGRILKQKGILKEEGKGVLTDAVLYFFLPCNIIISFQMEFDVQVFKKFAVVLGISVLIQAISYLFSKVLYNRKPDGVKRVMQYCTMVSNSGFLGLPIAEGIYGAEGMMYASIYIIPMRVMMWSVGIACFAESPDLKSTVKKLVIHPCIVAVYIGLGLMVFQRPLSMYYTGVLAAVPLPAQAILIVVKNAISKAVWSAGGCTTALTMILIGMMLAETNLKSLFDKDALAISAMRLCIIPALVFLGCRLFHVDGLPAGICVLMAGMPVASMTAILAAKYDCNDSFATKCVAVSTLLSMLTIPLWCMVL